MSSNDLTREEWRQQKIEKRAAFTKLQNLTYQEKLWRQAHMAKAFQEEMTDRGRVSCKCRRIGQHCAIHMASKVSELTYQEFPYRYWKTKVFRKCTKRWDLKL